MNTQSTEEFLDSVFKEWNTSGDMSTWLNALA